MFNRVGNNVFSSSRHRKQASWTSFESPFFGSGANKVLHLHLHQTTTTTSSSTDPEGDTKEEETNNNNNNNKTFSPSTPAPKQSGKSVATATTASMSGGTPSGSGSGGGGRFLHSPALTHTDDLTQVDPSRVSQGKITRAPPVLNMDDLPKIGMSTTLSTHRHRGVRVNTKNINPRPRRHYKDLPESKKKDEAMDVVETSSSEDDSDTPTSQPKGIRLSRRNAPQDPCMPMVLDDVRELVTTSVTKTLFFFNQVSNFFHEDGSSRRNHPRGGGLTGLPRSLSYPGMERRIMSLSMIPH